MPKISALPPIPSIATDDENPAKDTSAGQTGKWTFTTLKTWLQSLTSWISLAMLDNSTFDDVAKYAENAGNVAMTSTSIQTVASVSITVTKTTKILAMGLCSASSTSDTEWNCYIFVDGSNVQTGPTGAVNATGGGRYLQRGVNAIITLTAGTHTVSFRAGGSAGTLTIPTGRGQLVTALASMKNS